MRLKLTVSLFLLNLLLFGFILLLEDRTGSEAAEDGAGALLGAVVLQAERITIDGPEMDRPRILERSRDQRSWTMTSPTPWPANLFAVSRILNLLQFLEEEISFSVDEIVRSGQSLADYGLEIPKLTLRLEAPHEIAELKVGAATEMGNRIYLLGPAGNRIYVVDRRILESLLVSVNDLRNPRIFDIPVFEVRSLIMRITSPGDVTIRLAREGEQWSFEAPLAAAADPALVNTTIKELTGIEALRFFEPGEVDPAVSGLDRPTRRVTLQGNGRRHTLLLGNEVSGGPSRDKQYFAQLEGNPTLVTIPARPFDELFEAQQKLRDPTVFRFESARLNTIEIEHANRRVTLQRLENGEWQVLEIDREGLVSTQPADPEVMHQLISGMKNLEVREFVSDTPSATALNEEYGLTDPQWTLTLSTDADTMRLRIGQIYRRPDRQLLLYAKREQAPSVYGLPQRVLSLLRIDPLHYRDRRLRVLPTGARIASLRIEDLTHETVLLDQRIDPEAESWMDRLETLELDPEAKASLLNLLQYLRTFRVENYLRDTFTRNYLEEENKLIPWSYRMTVSILLTGGGDDRKRKETFYLTERLSGNFLAAGSPDHDLVFQLKPEMIESLFTFVHTRELPEEYRQPEPVPIERADEREPADNGDV